MSEGPPRKPSEDKWPWSITDREFGALEQEQKEIRHDLRNLKIQVDNSGMSNVTKPQVDAMRDTLIQLRQESVNYQDDVLALKKSVILLEKLSAEFSQFRSKVYFAASLIGLLAAVVAWLADVVLRVSSTQ